MMDCRDKIEVRVHTNGILDKYSFVSIDFVKEFYEFRKGKWKITEVSEPSCMVFLVGWDL